MGCDNMSKEPLAEKTELVFGAEGGEQEVRVLVKNKHPWHFGGLIDRQDEERGIIKPKEVAVDTLSDGVIRIQYEWATFHISGMKDEIKVRVAENRTPQKRKIFFLGYGRKLDGASFTVIQKGNPSKN